MSIVVKDLTKTYGNQNAIDGISFSAKAGEIVGLLGPNGAGKTTTMKILTCFMPPSSGLAEVCGLRVGEADMEIKKKVGYLPEHNPLYGSMYVKEYLNFVAKIHKVSNRKSRISDLIGRVGLSLEQNKKISQLSKGYKQRVGIAQAMIHDPEVIILDEPISGLDPNQLIEIRNLISDLKEDKTIIFSSHILQEVESICDKVVILDRGQVVADDRLLSLQDQSEHIFEIDVEVLHTLDLDLVKNLAGMQKVYRQNDTKFTVQAGVDIREDIFDLVAKQNNKLLGMQLKKGSLETVFKSVTKQ